MSFKDSCAASVLVASASCALQVHATEPIAAPGAQISVADFGAIPNDGNNHAPALRKALQFAKQHP
jgi:hypothetical protein